MRKTALFLIAFIPLLINAQDIQKLYDNNDFIRLSYLELENLEINQLPTPLLRAHTHSAMACYEESNKEIDILLTIDSIVNNPELMTKILKLQAINYYSVHKYKQAAKILKKVLDNYSNFLGDEIEFIQNDYRKYNVLSETKPLQVFVPHNTQVTTKSDKAGLPLVQIRSPKDTISVVFDTGAGMSCLTKSVAEKLGIRILGDSIIVHGSTGGNELAYIGVADTLYLDDILYTNAVFTIFNDEALTWPEYEYTMNGVIGFPQMKILPTIKIYRNGMLEIPKNSNTHKSNMMFTENHQIIVQANDSVLLWLDTGATEGELSVNYYNKNKKHIHEIGTLAKVRFAGLGGDKEFSVYKLHDFSITINANITVLPEIFVHIQPILGSEKIEFDGTLGQDVISQYDYMLLDFNNMYFSLENEN